MTPGPTAEEAAAWGLTLEEALGPPIEVWEDFALGFKVFEAMASQWRIGPGGATGLDYAALPAVMDLLDIPGPERRTVFEDVREMEDAAMGLMQEQRRRNG